MLNTITLSNVKYVSFKKRSFKFKKGEYDLSDSFESIGSDYVEYNPFLISDMYEKFANIDTSNCDGILNFIYEYGNIGDYNTIAIPYTEKCTYWYSEIAKMKQAILLSKLYSYENIRYEVQQLESKLNILEGTILYDLLVSNSFVLLELVKIKDTDSRYFKYSFLDKKDEEKVFESYKNNLKDISKQMGKKLNNNNYSEWLDYAIKKEVYDLRSACLIDLQTILKSNIGQLSFIPFIDIKDDDTPCFNAKINFPSLLSIMYWQLYMDFYENKKYYICEECKQQYEWNNNKKNYICDKCRDKKKSEVRQKSPVKKAHDVFLRNAAYYTLKGKSKCNFISKEDKEELWLIRDEIRYKSLEKMKELDERHYIIWLNKQNKFFMDKVEKYKLEE